MLHGPQQDARTLVLTALGEEAAETPKTGRTRRVDMSEQLVRTLRRLDAALVAAAGSHHRDLICQTETPAAPGADATAVTHIHFAGVGQPAFRACFRPEPRTQLL